MAAKPMPKVERIYGKPYFRFKLVLPTDTLYCFDKKPLEKTLAEWMRKEKLKARRNTRPQVTGPYVVTVVDVANDREVRRSREFDDLDRARAEFKSVKANYLYVGREVYLWGRYMGHWSAISTARWNGYRKRRNTGDKSFDWHTSAKAWLERESFREYQDQLRAWIKSGRRKSTFRYSPPDWQRDAIAFLGANDEEGFKALKLYTYRGHR
jgi:hypothetical protein